MTRPRIPHRSPIATVGVALALASIAIGLIACAITPPPPSTASVDPTAVAPADPIAPIPIGPGAATVRQAVLMEALTPRWGLSPDGPQLLDDFGEHLQVLDGGRRVAVLGDPQVGPDGTWVPVWIVPDPQTAQGDFYAWLPATQQGRPTIRETPSAVCPAVATTATLAALLPPDRFRCAGRSPLTIDAKTWLLASWPAYDVDPGWYGTNRDPGDTVSAFDGGPDPFGAGAPLDAARAGGGIDVRIPPTVEPPPLGMVVRFRGQFGDPSAENCTRTYRPPVNPGQVVQPGWGYPPEDPAASVEWCRDQFVAGGWEVVLGPEGRPIDLARPQLHRRAVDPPPGGVSACGGVGMPPLTIRIDPSKVDPVWIETPGGGRSLARFTRAFQLVLGDEPIVAGQNGVVIVNGEVLDPDRGKPGLAICPGGEVVDFEVLQARP
jgi:hypothetical protein